MRTDGFYFIILIFIGLQNLHAKTLFDRKGLEKQEALQTQSRIQHRSISNEADEDSDADASSGETTNFKVPKIDGQGTKCYDVPSAKRSIDDEDMTNRRDARFNKRRCCNRNFNGYGVVYKQGKPIGILEPISKIYEFQNIPMNDELRKRGVDDAEAYSSSDEMRNDYAAMLANFKMHNHGDYESLHNNINLNKDQLKHEQKRKAAESTSSIVSLKGKRAVSEANISAIENNLKEIMNDLGLIKDDRVEKRDVLQEDEDLENGYNKISLQKEMHPSERNKKESHTSNIILGDSSPLQSSSRQLRKGVVDLNEDVNNIPDSIDPLYKTVQKKAKIDDYRTRDTDNLGRDKREQPHAGAPAIAANAKPSTDIVKDLETSGELTVSGNKSPLASSGTSTSDAAESKHPASKNDKDEKRDRQAADQEMDKRVQRNIQQKISAIKEEVKREINAIKQQQQKVQTTEKKRQVSNDIGQKKVTKVDTNRKQPLIANKEQRVKRNLQQQETSNLNPVMNIESSDNIAHIRKRREISADDDADNEQMPKEPSSHRNTWRELHDLKEENSELTKRDGDESEQTIKKINHDPKNYEFVYRKKRNEGGDVQEASQTLSQLEVAKRNLDNDDDADATKHTESSSNSDLMDSQNQNSVKQERPLTRVIVTRDLQDTVVSDPKNNPTEKRDTSSATNKDKVDTLAKENGKEVKSSVKTTRSAHANEPAETKIEVELRSGGEKEVKTLSKGNSNTNAVKRERILDVTTSSDDKQKRDLATPQQAKEPVEEKSKVSEALNERKDDNFKIYESPVNKMAQEPLKFSEISTGNAQESKIDNKDSDKASELTNEEDVEDNKNKRSSEGKKLDKQATYLDEKRSVNVSNNNDNAKQSDSIKKDQSKYNDETKTVNRQERRSVPDLTLEDMQTLDSENNSKRKRRQIADYYYTQRNKRDKYIEPNNMQFRTYRTDDEEVENDSDEFDDDSFDDRAATLIKKRATMDNTNYDDIDEDYEPMMTNSENEQRGRLNKRNAVRKFATNINADVYDTPNYLSFDRNDKRRKRDVNLASLHDGEPKLRHSRSLKPAEKRLGKKKVRKQSNGNKEEISNLSEADIFGGLPQSYEGELTRFKRVKRDNSVKSY